jgi:uncharacterized membrane protein YbhN (UPF0104 family)
MWDEAVELAAALERALEGIAEAMAGVAPGWLAAGVLLHIANQVARGRGWFALVRNATGERGLRRRDAIAAWVAGAGAGGIASARGGDVVRVILLARRVPRAGAPCVAGTLVAEGAGELAVGAAIVAVAVAVGVGPEIGAPGASALWALPVALAVVGVVVATRRIPRLRHVAGGVGRGCAPLRTPGAYARRVLPWQLVSRACRAASLACLLAAFGLPVTPAVVLLVMMAQGGARLVPFAPASVGAGAAMLAATFEPVTGAAVPAGQVAAFFVGTSTALTAAGTVLGLVICLRLAAWPSLVSALRSARRAPARAEAYASANVGRSPGAGIPRAPVERAATVPTP